MKQPSLLRLGLSSMEMLAALSILAIIATLAAPAAIRHFERAKIDSVVEDFKAIEAAVAGYYADVGSLTPLNDIAGFASGTGDAAKKHFVDGDGKAGWNGPYLEEIKPHSKFGGTYDVDVFSAKSASIDLGVRSDLGKSYELVLAAVNEAFDGDNDTSRGLVWGDSNGIHYGFNYKKR